MFEYHCNCCGYDFFEEEGYNGELDAIICPMCEAIRYGDADDYIIEETTREIPPACPNCGNHFILVECGFNGKWTVQCRTCSYTTDEYDTKEKAIEAWNNTERK